MSNLAQSLRLEHEELEGLLTKLSEDTDSADPRLLQETWREFERCLTRHLRTEERQLLPLLIASSPDEVRSTLTEHERIRERVAELGVRVDLHTLRKAALLELVHMLRAHAACEERSLYSWIDRV